MVSTNNITWEDIRRFVDQRIDERLTDILQTQDKPASWQSIRKAVADHRWTPPPDAISSLELLREDRDS